MNTELFDYSKVELTGLPNSFFEKNRESFFGFLDTFLPELEKNSVLLLKGGDDIPRYDTDTNYCHFFQEANFYYLTGVREPGLDAAVDFNDRSITLFYDEPPQSTRYWQTVISTDEMKHKYGLSVHFKSQTENWLVERNPSEIYAFDGDNDISGKLVHGYKLKFENSSLQEKAKSNPKIMSVLRQSRKIKTLDEIGLMTFVCKETVKTHIEMMKAIKPELYERDIENVFNNYTSKHYYTRIWGYPCIAGCGENSATLHYEVNNKKMLDGEVFLGDMGMRFGNYVSDVTITVPVNGKFSQKQKEIYDIVLKSNREVMQKVKPGANLRQLDADSKRIILEELQKIGIILPNFSVDELMDAGLHRIFMPHGLGHYVGIEVHDVYDTSLLGLESYKFEKNNVITIEPGIYFRDILLDKAFVNPLQSKYLNIEKLKTYYDFGGVRIEDDVLVTEDGFINMTEELPRTTEEIERIMSNK